MTCRDSEGWRLVSRLRDFDTTPCFEEGVLLPSLLAIIFLISTSQSLILVFKEKFHRTPRSTQVLTAKLVSTHDVVFAYLFDNSCRLYCASPSPRVSPTFVTSLLCTKKSPSWDYISWSPLSSHPFLCSPTTITRVQDAPRLPCCSSGRSTSRPLPPGSALFSQRTSTRTRHWSSSNFSPHLLDQSRMDWNVWDRKLVYPSRRNYLKKIQNSLRTFTAFG